MADKITQKDVIDSSVYKSFKDLNTELTKSVKLMMDLTREAIGLRNASNPQNIQQVIAAQKESNIISEKSINVNQKRVQSLTALQKERIRIENQKKKILAQTLALEERGTKTLIKGQERLKIARKAAREEAQKALGVTKKQNLFFKNMASALGVVTGGFAIAAIAIRKTIEVFRDAIKVNREFEKTFANVLTLLDEAEKKEFRIELEKGSIDVAAKYGLEIKNVNEALFDAISNGIELNKVIEFLNKSAKLSIAGNAELSSVVKGSTKVYAVYKDEVESVDEILNAFFAAQVEGATNVELLASNIGKVAATAHTAGIPLNELFGTFAGLTKFLDGTEESSTALVNVINSIIKATPAAQKEFQKLGIETGITAVKQNGLLKTILQVVDATEDNNDIITELIPNIRAFKGFAGLTAESIAEIEKNISDLNDTELSSMLVQNAFNEQMNTSEKRAERMNGSYKRMLISVGGGESIFKRIGTAVKSELTEKFDLISKSVETFRAIWSGQMELIELAWQRVSGEIDRDEFREAVKKNAEETGKSLLSIAERYGDIDKIIDENTEKVDENTEKVDENTDEIKIQITTIADLNNQIAQLKKDKESLSTLDEAGIELINKEIEARQKQIKYLDELGIKEQEIVKIKQDKNEDILDLMDEQDEAEIEKLQEKLDNEFEVTQEDLERLHEARKNNRQRDLDHQLEVDNAKKESFKSYVSFATQQAKQLSDSIFGYVNSELDYQLQADIEKAKSRGASEDEIAKIEKDAAKKRKNVRLTQAIINTALGVTNALATASSWIEGIIAAVIVGAMGALEIATISSQSFAKGTKDSGAEWLHATVAEKGREKIVLSDGTSFYTPDKQTTMFLPPHSEVIPNHQLQNELAEMQAYGNKGRQQQDEERRKKEHKEMIEAIKNRDETTINITEGGFYVTAKKGNNFTKYIDRKYRD